MHSLTVATRIRTRYNVAVAEVDTQDSPGTLTLGVACLSTDSGHAHSMLEKVVRRIEASRMDAYLADYSIEMW